MQFPGGRNFEIIGAAAASMQRRRGNCWLAGSEALNLSGGNKHECSERGSKRLRNTTKLGEVVDRFGDYSCVVASFVTACS